MAYLYRSKEIEPIEIDSEFPKEKKELLKQISECKQGEARLLLSLEGFFTDHDVALAVLRKDGSINSQIFNELYKCKEYVKKHLAIAPHHIDDFDIADEELCIVAASTNGSVLDIMTTPMKKNKAVVLAAVKNDGKAYQFSSRAKDIRFDKEIITEALKQKGNALQDMPKSIKNDESYVKLAVASEGCSLRYAEHFNGNIHIVESALKNDGLALEHVSDEFKDNYELVELAIENNPFSILYASNRLRANKYLVMKSLSKKNKKSDRYHFHHVDIALRSDREIAIQAIRHHPISIRHLSYDLQDDSELADMAIEIDGGAYTGISNRLQLDKNLLLKALENLDNEFNNRVDIAHIHRSIPDELKNKLIETDLINSLKKLILNEKLTANLQVGDTTIRKMKV